MASLDRERPAVGSLDRTGLAVGSLVVVLALQTALARLDLFDLGPATVVAAVLAVLFTVPATVAVVLLRRRSTRVTDADELLRFGLAGVGAVAALVALVVAVRGSPGNAPLFGAITLSAGLFWLIAPLAVGAAVCAATDVSFERVLAAWPVSALAGGVLFVLYGGLVWDGLLYGDGVSRAVISLVAAVVTLVGPVGLATLSERLRG